MSSDQPPQPPPPPPYPAGYPAGYPVAYGAPPPTNTLAIVSLVTAFLCGPAGFVLGIIALRQIKRTREGGSGLAIGGIVVGGLSLLAALLVVVVFALGGVVHSEFHSTCHVVSQDGSSQVADCPG